MNQYKSFYLDGTLSIFRGEEVFLTATHIKILKQVIKDGSIHAAAKNLKMSYQVGAMVVVVLLVIMD